MGEMLGKNFDGDRAIEARVARAVHFAHSAGAERRLNFIGPEFRSRREGHGGRIIARLERVGESYRRELRRSQSPPCLRIERGDKGRATLHNSESFLELFRLCGRGGGGSR